MHEYVQKYTILGTVKEECVDYLIKEPGLCHHPLPSDNSKPTNVFVRTYLLVLFPH